MLRYWTAGESHGRCLTTIVDGFPAGLSVDIAGIDADLRRRQGGYGRGKRQDIETDSVEITAGVWNDRTLGSPLCLQIQNRDFKLPRLKELPRPRPGHADLSGALKYGGGIRAILERASARETAARVAAGSLARQLLREFGIHVLGHVVEIGGVEAIRDWPSTGPADRLELLRDERDGSAVYTLERDRDGEFRSLIDAAGGAGDTLGGVVEVRVEGLPFGLGSHAQWDRRLDGRIAQAVMAVQAIKGVEIGLGFEAARRRGSAAHDPILFDPSRRNDPHAGFVRPTNHAGGLEGGMTNGAPLVVRAAKKPISTLQKPLPSVDIATGEAGPASYERSDICAVPAAAIIVEAVVAFEVSAALIDKFGGDSVDEMRERFALYMDGIRKATGHPTAEQR